MSLDIIFLGQDGVGKSTLLKAVTDALPMKTVSGYLGIGQDGWRLGFAKALSKQHKGCLGNALFWYLALPVELLMRRVPMLRQGRGRVVMIDRVPGFPLLSNRVSFWLYRTILPRPCMVVLLTGDPVQIAARKPDETTQERTEKELRKWKRVAECLSAGRILEVNMTVNDLTTCRNMVVEANRTDPGLSAAMYKRRAGRGFS